VAHCAAEAARTAMLARTAQGRRPGAKRGRPTWRLPGYARQFREPWPGFSTALRQLLQRCSDSGIGIGQPLLRCLNSGIHALAKPSPCQLRCGPVVHDSPPHRGGKFKSNGRRNVPGRGRRNWGCSGRSKLRARNSCCMQMEKRSYVRFRPVADGPDCPPWSRKLVKGDIDDSLLRNDHLGVNAMPLA
jgi:hypothetical protein